MRKHNLINPSIHQLINTSRSMLGSAAMRSKLAPSLHNEDSHLLRAQESVPRPKRTSAEQKAGPSYVVQWRLCPVLRSPACGVPVLSESVDKAMLKQVLAGSCQQPVEGQLFLRKEATCCRNCKERMNQCRVQSAPLPNRRTNYAGRGNRCRTTRDATQILYEYGKALQVLFNHRHTKLFANGKCFGDDNTTKAVIIIGMATDKCSSPSNNIGNSTGPPDLTSNGSRSSSSGAASNTAYVAQAASSRRLRSGRTPSSAVS
ncbi:hypothetical protein HPB48_018264 [Haemaphysalis longicornis]|uniref:Uncharacterized protein n=1 Tax=Haemaphysalis longicornis TaxID=44386 RepID=A0A9J6FW55_HAELO|nr:hypothetical protein HPB48_018264 [Haemaphysalis longicornis]